MIIGQSYVKKISEVSSHVPIPAFCRLSSSLYPKSTDPWQRERERACCNRERALNRHSTRLYTNCSSPKYHQEQRWHISNILPSSASSESMYEMLIHTSHSKSLYIQYFVCPEFCWHFFVGSNFGSILDPKPMPSHFLPLQQSPAQLLGMASSSRPIADVSMGFVKGQMVHLEPKK